MSKFNKNNFFLKFFNITLGSSVLLPATADLYFTGEMSHHDILAALAKNTSVILCKLLTYIPYNILIISIKLVYIKLRRAFKYRKRLSFKSIETKIRTIINGR